jgi:hypothetical protein
MLCLQEELEYGESTNGAGLVGEMSIIW